MSPALKLALGTVQFGLNYGVANQRGQVPIAEARLILEKARSAGIDTLDTAIGYGDSEQRLGELGTSGWRIVSKLPGIPDACDDVSAWADASVRDCLDRLRCPTLYGLLLHRPDQLFGPHGPELYAALLRLKRLGAVGKIGVSIYDPSELDALTTRWVFDLVQAPFNLLDRRMIETGWFARLAAQGTEVHVRSIFLQGLLLMSRDARPAAFDRWNSLWRALDAWLYDAGLSPLQACVRDALSIPQIARVIVGVDSLKQFTDILDAGDGPASQIPAGVRTSDPDLLNPARWPALA